MCFSRRLVEQFGYPAFSVVEDVELALLYLRQGIRVRFVPGAHVLGQMAVSAGASNTQRARWEGGRLTLIRTQAWPLLKEGLRLRDAARIDGAIDLILPPFTLLVLGTALPVAAISAVWFLTSGIIWGITPILWGAALAIEIAYLLISLALIRAPAAIYRRLLAAPLFVAWKIGVYVRMALSSSRKQSTGEWVRTARHEMRKEQ
jgi:hypothetical protein